MSSIVIRSGYGRCLRSKCLYFLQVAAFYYPLAPGRTRGPFVADQHPGKESVPIKVK